MGILNRTPDSFSDGGKFIKRDAALRRIEEMINEGADIIDIGGESTRPGSQSISVDEELDRTLPIIHEINKNFPVPLSIDTCKHEVAMEAIKAGASLVNDVTAFKHDADMAGVVANSEAAVCLMHMKGSPKTMQDHPVYNDLFDEIIRSLKESIDIAQRAGIPDSRIMIDPGIGFGKTVLHNLRIINGLEKLKVLQRPILIGTSRKSFIGKITGKEAGERLLGTAITSALAIINGANMIRVHDIKEMVDAARMADSLKGARV